MPLTRRRAVTVGSRLHTRIGLVILSLGAGLLFLIAPTTPAAAADRDCGDFSTQRAAQDFFLDQGGPQNDPHRLDADSDGIACESNPCPCSTSQSGGGDGSGDGNTTTAVKRQ